MKPKKKEKSFESSLTHRSYPDRKRTIDTQQNLENCWKIYCTMKNELKRRYIPTEENSLLGSYT